MLSFAPFAEQGGQGDKRKKSVARRSKILDSQIRDSQIDKKDELLELLEKLKKQGAEPEEDAESKRKEREKSYTEENEMLAWEVVNGYGMDSKMFTWYIAELCRMETLTGRNSPLVIMPKKPNNDLGLDNENVQKYMQDVRQRHVDYLTRAEGWVSGFLNNAKNILLDWQFGNDTCTDQEWRKLRVTLLSNVYTEPKDGPTADVGGADNGSA